MATGIMNRHRLHTRVIILLLPLLLTACTSDKSANAVSKSSDYADLLTLFGEFREFSQPRITEGVPDYSADRMGIQYNKLKTFQERLKAIDPEEWTVSEQIDYHLVRAEMNGLEFRHRVMRPWARDPCFYIDEIPGVWRLEEFLTEKPDLTELVGDLESLPEICRQAQENMQDISDVPGDLAILANRRLKHILVSLQDLEAETEDPELVRKLGEYRDAIRDYLEWITKNQSAMTVSAGVGKENYNWLLKNVYLFPYTWEDCRRIVELEDNRVVTFQKLEENRNRNLPRLKPAASFKEYRDGIYDAVDHIMNFLREEEIFTLQDYMVPDDYYASRIEGKGYGEDKPWPEHHDYFFNFSHREPVMENTHELAGHHFDELRRRHDDRPIRGVRHPYKVSTGRAEGFAFALEELLMHAGYLDERPRRSREIAYEQAAFRTVRALADIYMHSGDWTLTEAMEYAVANAPNGELLDDSPHLWYEMETTLRGVGHHMIMVVGKVQFMEVFRDRAKQLGDDFVLKEFIDEYLEVGMVPQSLIRWELTGYEDEIETLFPDEVKAQQTGQSERADRNTSKIIYLSREGEKQNLCIMNTDGSGKKQLADPGFSVQWPCWSPDGNSIVFNSYDEGFFGIYIINSSGENLRKLDLDIEVPDIPCWSDDSKKIAFMAERSQGIQIADLDGNIRGAVGGEGIGAAYQRWSPTGTLLAFESGRDGNAEVYTMDAVSGEGLKRLTENDVSDEWPNFSWDGSEIAWARGVEGDMNVWIMNSDGSGQRQLTRDVLAGDGHASFSPDGSRIVFTSWSGKDPAIYTIKVDGSELKKIANGSNPCWSPF